MSSILPLRSYGCFYAADEGFTEGKVTLDTVHKQQRGQFYRYDLTAVFMLQMRNAAEGEETKDLRETMLNR